MLTASIELPQNVMAICKNTNLKMQVMCNTEYINSKNLLALFGLAMNILLHPHGTLR